MSEAANFKNAKQQQLHSLCRDKRLPVTAQRTVIMDALSCRKDHPTADQVYDQVKSTLMTVSRTTVYRVLETFVANGLAQKVGSLAAKARFDANAERHHHLECVHCGAIADLPHHVSYDIPLPESPEGLFQAHDYAILFKGVCAACLRNPGSH